MALQQPKNNDFVGGFTYLVFDEPMRDFDLTINDANFHYVKDDKGYFVDLNYIIPGQPIHIVVSIPKEDEPSVQTVLNEVTVFKPSHDTGGMGATIIRNKAGQIIGTFFKFWLPEVRSVYVRGSFNNWLDKNRLNQIDHSGYWYGFSEQARPGDDYIFFVYVDDGQFDEVSDPAARATKKTRHNSDDDNDANAIIIDSESYKWQFDTWYLPQRREFSKHIIYQLHWGTFLRADDRQPNFETFVAGDNENTQRENIRWKLAYIQDLGFTAIAFLPLHQASGSYDAGYNPSFFFAIETAYSRAGNALTLTDDLKMLIDEAHRLGLAVFFDAVINHLSKDYNRSSFSQNFLKDYYIKENAPWSNNNLWGDEDWGPDPDFDRTEIRNLLGDCIRMYFEEYHIDGVRFDATKTIPDHALKPMIGKLIDEYKTQGKFLIAEHIDYNPFPYIIEDIGFNACWYQPAYNLSYSSIFGYGKQGSLSDLRTLFETDADGNQTTALKYILGSHDEVWIKRKGIPSIVKLGGANNFYALSKIRLAYALNTCSLGVPMLFMGTENLAPIIWDNYDGYNGANGTTPGQGMDWQPAENSAAWQFKKMIKQLNQLHTESGAFRFGNNECELVHYDESNGILGYKRWDYSGCVLLIIINISDNQWEHKDYQINCGIMNSVWREIFNTQVEDFGGWQNSGNSEPGFYPNADFAGLMQGINLPKWSLLILKQRL